MADTVTIPLCILWEGELRQAARALKAAFDAAEDDPQRNGKLVAALTASRIALAGLTDDKAVCMIGSDEIRKDVRKQKRRNG